MCRVPWGTRSPCPQLYTDLLSALHTLLVWLEVGKAFQAPHPWGSTRDIERGRPKSSSGMTKKA